MLSRLNSVRTWTIAVLVGLAAYTAWYFTAYPRGMLMAYVDHARGRDEVLCYGLPGPCFFEECQLLQERYGVNQYLVAGCVVSHELRSYADGYNSVSQRLIIEKHGKDIFKECEALAE